MTLDEAIQEKRDLIDKIEEIRCRNNRSWMKILKLAFEIAPQEAAALMREINANDSDVGKLTQQLSVGLDNKD